MQCCVTIRLRRPIPRVRVGPSGDQHRHDGQVLVLARGVQRCAAVSVPMQRIEPFGFDKLTRNRSDARIGQIIRQQKEQRSDAAIVGDVWVRAGGQQSWDGAVVTELAREVEGCAAAPRRRLNVCIKGGLVKGGRRVRIGPPQPLTLSPAGGRERQPLLLRTLLFESYSAEVFLCNSPANNLLRKVSKGRRQRGTWSCLCWGDADDEALANDDGCGGSNKRLRVATVPQQ